MAKSKTGIKDIFDGEVITVWEDEEYVTLALGLSTIAFPKEYWNDFKNDLKKLVDL
jgi:hypothetical protein